MNEDLLNWVEKYYAKIEKKSNINGSDFFFYKSMRGYFRHSILLTDIKVKEFGPMDYKIWDIVLTKIKSGKNPAESGGFYFRIEDFKGVCSRRSFYASKRKFLELKLILKTPFKNYYLINPLYIIKLYAPNYEK